MQQVLGLTYESVLPEGLDQYLGTIFNPLRPLMLYGRDASQQPQCKPKEAVYWGWKDTVWGVGCGMWGVGCGAWLLITRSGARAPFSYVGVRARAAATRPVAQLNTCAKFPPPGS